MPTTIPTGTWTVDPTAGRLGFRSRGVFGLVPVKGVFTEYGGELHADAAGVQGELRIQSASLDTKHGKRDTHLKSEDFFAVEDHPVLTFTLTGVSEAGDALNGSLRIRENVMPVTAPLSVEAKGADRLVLTTALSVDRSAAGVGWSKAGMIQGKAHLDAEIVLVRSA